MARAVMTMLLLDSELLMVVISLKIDQAQRQPTAGISPDSLEDEV